MSETFLNGKVTLYAGDCLAVLPQLPADSVDCCATDAPYHLASIVKRFGAADAAPAQFGADGRYARASAGFMGQQWDGGDVAFRPETWAAVLRVLKPGGHLVAFGAPKNAHRMICAIEDAGFEIRDSLLWLFGSGFPKSLDVSKAIDRAAGAKRETTRAGIVTRAGYGDDWDTASSATRPRYDRPATTEAARWQGWGTALKPAYEPICLARKPLAEPTVAANVLRWGTGGLNIDAARVAGDETTQRLNYAEMSYHGGNLADRYATGSSAGRWPANVCHDGSGEVVAAFPLSDGAQGVVTGLEPSTTTRNTFSLYHDRAPSLPRGDSGSAARFFYSAKADSDDRLGSKHPTVKPVDLMCWLLRLICPPGGLVIDPFAGTGTTGEAAYREGMRAVLIEREAAYLDDIRRRMRLATEGPMTRAHASAKARGRKPPPAPLFGEAAE